MHIQNINIKNFRLLENVNLTLEKKTTVIVGRNNSGKTSLTELFHRLLNDKAPIFSLEDFSLSQHEKFWKAYELKKSGADDKEIRDILPAIEVKLTVSYEKNSPSYGPLSEFIIDLDPDCTTTQIVISYELEAGKIDKFFENIALNTGDSIEKQRSAFCKIIKQEIPKFYSANIYAQDPNDGSNTKTIEWNKLKSLMQNGFINAQRGLDDPKSKDGADPKKNNKLGNILEQLFMAAANSNKTKDKEIVASLETAIQDIQQSIDEGFNVQLGNLFPTFALFGYPGLSDPKLLTETTLDVQRLLKNHTRVHYAGVNGINLPEAYNGLGTRNLIYILLQLLEFYKDFTSKDSSAGMHLVFIEEPEAHLHPQMQEVFIQKLGEISAMFARTFGDAIAWPVQFIVTTHSPHMANKSAFESLRYFLTHPHEGSENIRTTEIKDLKKGLAKISATDKEFLHKYMTLTRCDLMFADKVILIEGATERIMMPEIMSKIDASHPQNPPLRSQFISIMEVGGAYAHRFFDLLDFLDLSTLIITDIDSVKLEGGKNKACEVSLGTKTSNACIKDWFDDNAITPATLIAKNENDKIDGNLRLSYQIPETGSTACGRSFEDAFILANHTSFGLMTASATEAWDLTKEIAKTSFAIEYGIEKASWNVPRYLVEGLVWLSLQGKSPPQPNEEAILEAAE